MATQKLYTEQVERMAEVISSDFSVHSRGDLPDLSIKPERLILAIMHRFDDNNITMTDIRINGGFASVIVGGLENSTFNDLDILFNLDSPPNHMPDRTRHDFIRKCVIETLFDFVPDTDHNGNVVEKCKVSLERLAEEYVQKAICVQNGSNDLWSLITLRNNVGKNIELKFVDRLRRKYEFSIDSFQLIISDYLEYLETFPEDASLSISPSVSVESVFGDFETALNDLENRLIRTQKPEEIRGGGMLKYCYLISCGYKDADPKAPTLKKYMCSRFFIDFPEVHRQQLQLENYLTNHFSGCDHTPKRTFLSCVVSLVQKHSVCLPVRERNRTLSMIHTMALQYMHPNNPEHSLIQTNTFSYSNVYNNYSNFYNIYSNNNNVYSVYNHNNNSNNNAFNSLHLSFYTQGVLPQQPIIQS